ARAIKRPLGNHRPARQRSSNRTGKRKRIYAECVGDGTSLHNESGAVIECPAHIPEPQKEGPIAERESMCLISTGLFVELVIDQPGIMNLGLSRDRATGSSSKTCYGIRHPA